jgi:hypothetical protein
MYPPKLGCGLYMEYLYFFKKTRSSKKQMIEPVTPVFYIVKTPVETFSVCAYCWQSQGETSQ